MKSTLFILCIRYFLVSIVSSASGDESYESEAALSRKRSYESPSRGFVPYQRPRSDQPLQLNENSNYQSILDSQVQSQVGPYKSVRDDSSGPNEHNLQVNSQVPSISNPISRKSVPISLKIIEEFLNENPQIENYLKFNQQGAIRSFVENHPRRNVIVRAASTCNQLLKNDLHKPNRVYEGEYERLERICRILRNEYALDKRLLREQRRNVKQNLEENHNASQYLAKMIVLEGTSRSKKDRASLAKKVAESLDKGSNSAEFYCQFRETKISEKSKEMCIERFDLGCVNQGVVINFTFCDQPDTALCVMQNSNTRRAIRFVFVKPSYSLIHSQTITG